MRIEKNCHDKNYPYTLIGDWEQKMSCSREDLIALKYEIDQVLDQPREPQPHIASCGSIGGQMIWKMIEECEGKKDESKRTSSYV